MRFENQIIKELDLQLPGNKKLNVESGYKRNAGVRCSNHGRDEIEFNLKSQKL